MNWCITILSLTLFLAIMDKAESYIGTVPDRKRESRPKHFERKVPLQDNFEMFPNKLRKLGKEVKKRDPLIENFTFL